MVRLVFGNYHWAVEQNEDGAIFHTEDDDSKIAVSIPVFGDSLDTLIKELVEARENREVLNS